jgi:GNAT superfamily N-acetyltransferase
MAAEDHGDVLRIARGLPQWFTAKGLDAIARDLPHHHGYVALRGRSIVGFITHFTCQGGGRIGWVGVQPHLHRQGIGRRLVNAVVEELRRRGFDRLEVSTLSDSVEYEPYERTRAFYLAMGFAVTTRIPHPDNPECPEEMILARAV